MPGLKLTDDPRYDSESVRFKDWWLTKGQYDLAGRLISRELASMIWNTAREHLEQDYELTDDYKALEEVLRDAMVRFGELLNDWYGDYTGDESPTQLILHGKQLVLDDSGKERPDVVLYRRMLLACGVKLEDATCDE